MTSPRRSIRFVAVTAFVMLCLPRPAASGQWIGRPALERVAFPADVPAADSQVWWLEETGRTAKRAREALAAAPDALDTAEWQLRAYQLDRAIEVLGRVIDRHPGDIDRALNLAAIVFDRARLDDRHDRRDALRDLSMRAQAALQRMPREDAARTARAVLALDQIGAPAGEHDAARQLTRFVAQWGGTTAALQTEVDVIAAAATGQKQVDALATFVREHPNTTAAAKAQYLRGFQLAYNGGAFDGYSPGADPLRRFMLVRGVVDDLLGGGYPRSEWTDRALELLTGFGTYEPTYSDETVRTMRGYYERFARTHFDLDHSSPTGVGAGAVVTHMLAGLYASRGDKISGVERLLTGWSDDPEIGLAARFLLAAFYLDLVHQASDGAARADMVARASHVLQALDDGGSGVYRQKALAALAVLEQEEHIYPAAVVHLTAYIQRYPESVWTWVAALRLGRAYESLGDAASASAAYLNAASIASTAVGRVLGSAYAAEIAEADGRFDEALVLYQRARGLWDDDFGERYALEFMRTPRSNNRFADLKEPGVDRVALAARIDELERALRARGGVALARARWLVDRDRPDAAIEILRRAAGEHARSPLASEARALLHRALVVQAFTTGGMSALVELERDRFDEWVAIARIVRAAALWRGGDAAAAAALTAGALHDWRQDQDAHVSMAPPSALANDVDEIRNLVFRPTGDGLFPGSGFERAFRSQSSTPYYVINPAVRVKLSTGETVVVTTRAPLREYPTALFMDDEPLAFFDQMIAAMDGRPWAPHSGPQLSALLQKFFPVGSSQVGRWMVETAPVISAIEFLDAARTKAAVRITAGVEGATILLEKHDGVWTFKKLTGHWIA